MAKRKLQLESLEDRRVMAAFGNPWPAPERLTVSFVPDGTRVGEAPSALFSALDATLGREVWQREALRALQTWAQYAPLNFDLLVDEGLPLGEGGPLQAGRQQGDLRLAAAPLAPSEIAVGTPFDLLGDWAGDVVLNSNYRFGQGDRATAAGDPGQFDLYTVLLQEFGHALGLPNSGNPDSVMYTAYRGARTGLHTSDITALRALYGPRRADRFEPNGMFFNARRLQFVYDADQFRDLDPGAGSAPFVARAELTSAGDVDFYRASVPADLHDFHVEVRTAGLSLLRPTVSVLDANRRVVASATAGQPGAGVSLFVADALPGQQYWIRVEGRAAGVFGVGAYHLAVGKEAREAVYPAVPNYFNDDRPDDDGGGPEPLVALTPRTATLGPQWDYVQQASLSFTGDFDRYRVVAPQWTSGGTATLVASVWGLEADRLEPGLQLYASATGQLLRAQIVRNDRGAFTLQWSGVLPGQAYEIRVLPGDAAGANAEGNYLLAVDFARQPLALTAFAAGELTAAESQRGTALTVRETRLWHLVFSAASDAPADVAVRMTIYDQNQQVVRTLVARAGETVSTDLLLPPGEYFVRFAAGMRDAAQALVPVRYDLRGAVRNDPIGPLPVPPSITPLPPPPAPTYPVPPPPPPPLPPSTPLFNWTSVIIPPWIGLLDPYSNPWSGL